MEVKNAIIMKKRTKTLLTLALLAATTQMGKAAITVEKLWEKTTDIFTVGQAKQGVGYDGNIYVQYYNSSEGGTYKIYKYAKSNGARSEYATSGAGSGIVVDDAGNLAVRNEYFATSNPSSLKIYKKGSTTAKTITFSLPAPERCDYNSASGDFWSSAGGYVWYMCKDKTQLQYVKISNAGNATPSVSTGYAPGGGSSFASIGTVSHIMYGSTLNAWVGQTRSNGFRKYNGTTVSNVTLSGSKLSTLGGCMFTFKGTGSDRLLYLYNSGSTNYNSEFKIHDMTNNVAVATGLGIGDREATSSAYANWITASKIDQWQWYVHQFCPAVGVALYLVREYTAFGIGAGSSSNVTTTTATVKATATGTYNPKNCTIKYGTSAGSLTSTFTGSYSGKNLTGNLTGLTPNTTYYYTITTTSNNPTKTETVTTTVQSFTTPPAYPTVVTGNYVFSSLKDQITLNATYSGGTYPITTRGFYYGTNQATLTTTGATVTVAGAGSPFSCKLVGLDHGTTYYYRAFTISNGVTTLSSTTNNFTTPANVIAIAANQSKEIPQPFSGNLVIYHGGQVTNSGEVVINGRVFYKRVFDHPTSWNTFSLPFYIYETTVYDPDDNTEYPIEPVHGTYPYSGHFWLKTMSRDTTNYEIDERWNTPPTQNHVIWGKQPHIIAFPDAGGYYNGKTITFATESHLSGIIRWFNNDNSIKNKPEGVYFVPNYTLKNQNLTDPQEVSAFYRLDLAGDYSGNFEERINSAVKPSECFIRIIYDTPVAAAMAPARIGMSNVGKTVDSSSPATAAPPVVTYQPLLVTTLGNKMMLMSEEPQTVTIFTTTGTKIATYQLAAGENRTVELPEAIYIVTSNKSEKPIKVVK